MIEVNDIKDLWATFGLHRSNFTIKFNVDSISLFDEDIEIKRWKIEENHIERFFSRYNKRILSLIEMNLLNRMFKNYPTGTIFYRK